STIRAIAAALADKYRILLWKFSIGSDSLAFVILPEEGWRQWEQSRSPERMRQHFIPVTQESKMFDMGGKEVMRIMSELEGLQKS
ncbi:MAG: hypothetical protein Q3966_04865, partial [Neisseria sp.]|nr:hypothetical protein [Neisseria sp.]